ncbi:uncharacterized protein LOC110674217 [Aedes aegypti]|uniref:Uncharacterized protein n=1 Tax=Aedes aegypti TaxID=7159 RepID=A0A6I8TY76_AEDAE|nr:uncharacterized protein LOC110674217 [Aedes aegypti]
MMVTHAPDMTPSIFPFMQLYQAPEGGLTCKRGIRGARVLVSVAQKTPTHNTSSNLGRFPYTRSTLEVTTDSSGNVLCATTCVGAVDLSSFKISQRGTRHGGTFHSTIGKNYFC